MLIGLVFLQSCYFKFAIEMHKFSSFHRWRAKIETFVAITLDAFLFIYSSPINKGSGTFERQFQQIRKYLIFGKKRKN